MADVSPVVGIGPVADIGPAADIGNVGGRTAVGATWLIAWRMVTRALGLLSTLVLARILVPSDFGLVAMATTFSGAIDALSELGLLEALIRRPDTDRSLYDTAFTMQALRGLITGGVIAAGALGASEWFQEPRLFAILLLLSGLSVLSGFDNIGIVEFRRALRFSMEFKLLFLPRITQFVVTISATWLLHSYWALIIGIAVAKTSRTAMTYVVHPYRPGFSLSRWRDLVGFSFWTWASSLASLVWDRADPFILGPVLGARDLGIYLLAAEIAILPITELVAPATRALFSGFSIVQHRGTDTVGMALSVVSAMLLMVVPLAIGVSATSGYLVAVLLGPNWNAAQPLIATFAWLCMFAPFSWVCGTVLTARGDVRQNFYVIAAAATVKAVVIYVASLSHDMNVVARAAVICVAVESILFMLQLRGRGDAKWREAMGGFLRIGIAGCVTAAALYQSGYAWQVVTLPSGLALVYGGALGVAAITGFSVLQFILWTLPGRPDGPERRLLDLAIGFNLPIPSFGVRRRRA